MRQVVPISSSKGIEKEKAVELLGQGWTVFPKVSVAVGSKVATLTSQAPLPIEVWDFWCSPAAPTIPELGVAYLLIDVAKEGGDLETIERIIRPIFGKDMTVEVLEKRVPPRRRPEEKAP